MWQILKDGTIRVFFLQRWEKFNKFLQSLRKKTKCWQISNFEVDNVVDFKRWYKTRILFHRSAPIQPKPAKSCRTLAKNLRQLTEPLPRAHKTEISGSMRVFFALFVSVQITRNEELRKNGMKQDALVEHCKYLHDNVARVLNMCCCCRFVLFSM